MPYHRTPTTAFAASSPRIAQLAEPSAGGMADSRFATDEATPGCPARGGRVLSSGRIDALLRGVHTVEQPEAADLSANLGNPSRLEQWLAGAAIVGMVLGLPILLAGGWPLTLLVGGGQ